jgi:hypothetical protein
MTRTYDDRTYKILQTIKGIGTTSSYSFTSSLPRQFLVALSLVIEDERGDRTFPDKGDVQGGNKRDGSFGGKRGYPNWTGTSTFDRAQMQYQGED